MKKKICLITAVSVLTSMLAAFNAEAVSYSVGTRLEFESPFSTGTDKIVQISDEQEGGMLKFSAGGQMTFDFSELTSGTYRISFDLNMSSTESTPFDIYTNTPKADNSGWQQMSFMRLNSGVVGTLANNTGNGAQIGTATYAANTWQRYDIVMPLGFEDERYADVYIDGVKKGEIDLNNNSVYGMKFILFLFSDWRGDKSTEVYALLDNFEFKKVSDSAYMSAENVGNDFKINFSETMPQLTKDDFSLKRISEKNGAEEDVPFTFTQTSGIDAVISAEAIERGYTYVLSLSDEVKTALGNEVVRKTYSFEMPTPVEADYKWDFEDGVNPVGGKTELAEFENRGTALKYTASANGDFRVDNGKTLDYGTYIFSYDMMKENVTSNDYMFIRLYGAKTAETRFNFETMWKTGEFGEFGLETNHLNGWGVIPMGLTVEGGVWHRIDNVMDMDERIAHVYVDGEYSGDINLKDKNIDALKGAMLSVNGGVGYYDNISIRNLNDSYAASLTVKDNKLYIDFDETTTNLTEDNFTVKRSANSFSDTTQVVSATLVYQNGARAVLELDDGVTGGAYTVDFNGISSFLGNSVIPYVSADAQTSAPDEAVIGSVSYKDAQGNSNDVFSVSSTTSEIGISYPNGMQGGTFNGTVNITCNGEEIGYSGEWDNENKVYTIKLNKMLGADNRITINAFGSIDENGNEYREEEGSFTTSAAVFEISNFNAERGEGVINVSLDCVNTNADDEYSLVWAGYSDDRLAEMYYQPLTFEKNSIQTEYSFDFADGDYDNVRVWLWHSFNSIKPVMSSICK